MFVKNIADQAGRTALAAKARSDAMFITARDGPLTRQAFWSLLKRYAVKAGIPAARNAALEAAKSISPDWIAFIDDDEVAPRDWIARLHAVAVHYGADVTSGWVVQVETAAEAELGAQGWKMPTAFG